MPRSGHSVMPLSGCGTHRDEGFSLCGRDNPVGLWIDCESDRVYLDQAVEPCASDSVSAVHEPPIGREDDGVPQVSIVDSAGVLGHLSAGGGLASEPAVFVELHDVRDRHLKHRQIRRRRPEALCPPERAATRHMAADSA